MNEMLRLAAMSRYDADMGRYARHGRGISEDPKCPAFWAKQIRACFPTLRWENGAAFAAREFARRFSADHQSSAQGQEPDVFWANLLSVSPFEPERETFLEHLIRIQ